MYIMTTVKYEWNDFYSMMGVVKWKLAKVIDVVVKQQNKTGMLGFINISLGQTLFNEF